MARERVTFFRWQLGFALNLKKSVLTPTQRIELLEVAVDSLIMTLSLLEKKACCLQLYKQYFYHK